LRAVERIQDGRLPCVSATGIDAGYGTGILCALCDQSIVPDKIEYDVTDPKSSTRMDFHFAYHEVWQRERAQRLKDSRFERRLKFPE